MSLIYGITEMNVSVEPKQKVDVVISINVYKSLETLRRQLDTIDQHVQCSYLVLLNCNESFFQTLQASDFKHPKVVIHPVLLNKIWFHGTLTQGIVNNMKFAIDTFDFEYFIVLSGRTIFYRTLTKDNLQDLQTNRNLSAPKSLLQEPRLVNIWHWPNFNKTLLAKYYYEKGYTIYGSYHEGMVFSAKTCRVISTFLDQHSEISNDLFNFPCCVEEFALQTVASNESEDGYFYIGNGHGESCDVNNTTLFTRKILFLT